MHQGRYWRRCARSLSSQRPEKIYLEATTIETVNSATVHTMEIDAVSDFFAAAPAVLLAIAALVLYLLTCKGAVLREWREGRKGVRILLTTAEADMHGPLREGTCALPCIPMDVSAGRFPIEINMRTHLAGGYIVLSRSLVLQDFNGFAFGDRRCEGAGRTPLLFHGRPAEPLTSLGNQRCQFQPASYGPAAGTLGRRRRRSTAGWNHTSRHRFSS